MRRTRQTEGPLRTKKTRNENDSYKMRHKYKTDRLKRSDEMYEKSKMAKGVRGKKKADGKRHEELITGSSQEQKLRKGQCGKRKSVKSERREKKKKEIRG